MSDRKHNGKWTYTDADIGESILLPEFPAHAARRIDESCPGCGGTGVAPGIDDEKCAATGDAVDILISLARVLEAEESISRARESITRNLEIVSSFQRR